MAAGVTMGAHTQWNLATGVSLEACGCIAGGVSSKHLPGDGKQLWGPRLVPCTHVATELWAGCWCGSGLQQQ